ncbi:hypothetical protein [Albidovulum sp.]|uniref:hypothetical protein n=1 Tax=Albidovulum sp. TaxID=1872424 RepID=UPI0025C312AB|nr:hypothetical protein [Defluviimonas sp.]
MGAPARRVVRSGEGAAMLILSFLGPVVASVLYVIVFQKAGFRGPILFVAAGPVVGAVLTRILVSTMVMGSGPVAGVFLFSAALSLAPLIVLAFMAWPPATLPGPRISTEKH